MPRHFFTAALFFGLYACRSEPAHPAPTGDACADACAQRAACCCLEVSREACLDTCRRAVPVGLLSPAAVTCAARAQTCAALDACPQVRCPR